MRVFVWERVEKCTDNWHTQGGVVVFAETEERARELANGIPGCHIESHEHPVEDRTVRGGLERIYLFPDAGCC